MENRKRRLLKRRLTGLTYTIGAYEYVLPSKEHSLVLNRSLGCGWSLWWGGTAGWRRECKWCMRRKMEKLVLGAGGNSWLTLPLRFAEVYGL